ncbi:hypothetical protein C1645_813533 [Glomus cerebriforme]|uniref:Uncharacterized protein n=1 Tax=Glomus cerebriforme TaxID=658196 RepID=A0A397THV3_9GLOM|nr:hypothetical protein C1645_813533 [Glomus cerebriforme]
MENQESSANMEVPFDVTEITADDINIENIVVTSSYSATLKFTIHLDEPIKEFTMATCGCLYYQKCFEDFLLNVAKIRAKLSCPNWDCKGREIKTLITQDLFKEMDKPTTLTAEDTVSKQVYSENATLVSEDANEIYMNQFELFTEENSKSLEEINESASSFLQLSERIDHAETKNEEASRGLIFSYFNFGKAVYKRYKELKSSYDKDESEALVKKEVRKTIPETKCSDETLRKRTEGSEKIYKLFNSIDKEFNKAVPKPVNNRPRYDMKYISAYMRNYGHGTDLEKIIKTEKLYDDLSIIRSHETSWQWAVQVRGFGKGKVTDDRYYRPRIHKSQIAICFDCWKLVKITDVKPKKTYFSGWCRYGYEVKPEDLMKLHLDNECSKAKTQDGSARLIQRAYRNYRKQPETFAKQVWKAVRNDNTPKEKKFLSMPGREIRCTVNLEIWYSIDELYRPYHVLQNQLYDYKSYSKHKRCQLSDRIAIARNKIQCNYLASAPEISAYSFERSQVLIDAKAYFNFVWTNAGRK